MASFISFIKRKIYLSLTDMRSRPSAIARNRRRTARSWARAEASGFRWERINFRLTHGYNANLTNPQTYNEKVVCKKLFDRNPLLPIVADKYRMRAFVCKRLEPNGEDHLIPLLHVTDNPEDIPFDTLTGSYVIKATHGSRMNIFVREGDKIDRDIIIAKCKNWLAKDFGVTSHQWCYHHMPHKIIIKRLLVDETGNIPSDFKISCYDGEARMFLVVNNRCGKKSAVTLDKELKPILIKRYGIGKIKHIELPDKLSQAIELAEKLAEGFEFLRIDLYFIGDQIYVGELTNYPCAGLGRFRPRSTDHELGKLWSRRQPYLPDH